MKSLVEFYKNKKVLVTGGAGFIGSHLVEELINLGAKVTILDNFSSGNLNNLKSIITNINIIYGSITDPFVCFKATADKEIVFHLAALVSVPFSIQNPSFCKQVNTIGTQNLLEGCKKNNCSTFIFSSSAAVYGNKEHKCIETDKINPLSPYAQSKIDSENLCEKYSYEHNINTSSLRYFNVYGERQNPDGEYAAVVAKFKHNLESGKPLIIFGDGKQTRDFIHVSKVIQANLQIAMQSFKGERFNIASGKSITLLELIEQLRKEINIKKVDILFQASRKGDILNSAASCEKIKKFIQF